MPEQVVLPDCLSCEQVDEVMVSYAYGLLSVRHSNQVTNHLLACQQHREDHWERFLSALSDTLTDSGG